MIDETKANLRVKAPSETEKDKGRGEGWTYEGKRDTGGLSWGSCHTSREMFQMVFFVCCNGVIPFIGEPK